MGSESPTDLWLGSRTIFLVYYNGAPREYIYSPTINKLRIRPYLNRPWNQTGLVGTHVIYPYGHVPQLRTTEIISEPTNPVLNRHRVTGKLSICPSTQNIEQLRSCPYISVPVALRAKHEVHLATCYPQPPRFPRETWGSLTTIGGALP